MNSVGIILGLVIAFGLGLFLRRRHGKAGRLRAQRARGAGLLQDEVPEPEEGPATPPSTAPDDARAARHSSDQPPPPVEVLPSPIAASSSGDRPMPPGSITSDRPMGSRFSESKR